MKDAVGDERPVQALMRSPERENWPWISAIAATPIVARMAVSLALLASVTTLDLATGGEISFSVFYLAPVLFAGTFISCGVGRVMAVVSAAIWGYLDGTTGPVYSSPWIVVWNSLVRLVFLLLVNELVHTLMVAHRRQHELARTDSLTGIPNARVFRERVEQEIARSRRDGQPFSVAYIDLDHFKQINDDSGHSEGDRLLREFATVLDGAVRTTDVAARLGGDEFGILMPKTDAEEARTSLERVQSSIAEGLGKRWGLEATIGSMTFERPPHDFDDAVRLADTLMYRGKAEGRRRVVQGTWPER